ncbi:hypothetical protein SRDD_42590 [Serratia sp. DD3]|nr:hypothetical protein SRDD_42590 [Serratia sp. DD3]
MVAMVGLLALVQSLLAVVVGMAVRGELAFSLPAMGRLITAVGLSGAMVAMPVMPQTLPTGVPMVLVARESLAQIYLLLIQGPLPAGMPGIWLHRLILLQVPGSPVRI